MIIQASKPAQTEDVNDKEVENQEYAVQEIKKLLLKEDELKEIKEKQKLIQGEFNLYDLYLKTREKYPNHIIDNLIKKEDGSFYSFEELSMTFVDIFLNKSNRGLGDTIKRSIYEIRREEEDFRMEQKQASRLIVSDLSKLEASTEIIDDFI
ncbi:hypothetical protein [Tetragenococcus halophilus]|uniref:hypothetical protein n=1 Tax=Tetragenococcus halophilus TaxID=51669 RepID=UPI0030105D44